MKVILKVPVRCLGCGWIMYDHEKYIECVNLECPNYQKKYEYPTIELREYKDAKEISSL